MSTSHLLTEGFGNGTLRGSISGVLAAGFFIVNAVASTGGQVFCLEADLVENCEQVTVIEYVETVQAPSAVISKSIPILGATLSAPNELTATPDKVLSVFANDNVVVTILDDNEEEGEWQ